MREISFIEVRSAAPNCKGTTFKRLLSSTQKDDNMFDTHQCCRMASVIAGWIDANVCT